MKNTQLYLFCKKIHRLLVLLIFVLGTIMGSTGYMMRESVYFFLPALQIRLLHNTFSMLFAIVLGVMTLTGLYMFLFPYLKIKQEDPPKPLVN